MNPCDLPGAGITPGCAAVDAAKKGADQIGTVIEFGKDPIGFIAQKEAEAAQDLSENVIPALAHLTQPDLTTDWFISAYQVSFAAAILGWVVILLWDLATFRGRGESGREVINSLAMWSPIFIGGSMFGPLAGTFVLSGIGSLNAALINWGISASAEDVVESLRGMVEDDPSKFMGGSFVAMVIFAALVLSLLLLFLVLLVMLVTLYFSGVVFPLSLMWATKIGQRDKGRKVIMVWAGILCSQPLIFLLLGFAFSGATSEMMDLLADYSPDDPAASASLRNLVMLCTVIIMMVVATLGPTSLAAYAPVGPTEGTPSGPAMNARGAGRSSGGARGGAGASSPSSSQASQAAQSNAQQQTSMASNAASGGGGAAATAGGAAATGGMLIAAKAAQEGGQGLADKAGELKSSTEQTAQAAQDGTSGPDGSGTTGGAGHDGGGAGRDGQGGESGDDQSAGLAGNVGQSGDSQGGKGGGKKAAAIAAGAGQKAAQLSGRAVGLAQTAGDHAAEQMDHHRDGARGQR